MFSCERCGSRYSAKAARGHEYCPRCLGRDGVVAKLGFAPFGQAPSVERVAAEPGIEDEGEASSPLDRPAEPPADLAVERVREAAQRLDA